MIGGNGNWSQSGENGPTLAYDDKFSTAPNVPLTTSAANGVLANDIDPEGDQIAATLHEDPTSGQLDLQLTGAFTYIPGAEFVGLDQFVYVAYDFNQDPVHRLPAEFGVVTIEVIGQSGITGDLNGDGSPEHCRREPSFIRDPVATGVLVRHQHGRRIERRRS